MARTKQTGPEVKLYQIDTMVYLGTKNILTKLSMFAEFIKCGGVAIADENGINRARALERFDKNYKIQEITTLAIDGQANETWLRKNGLLQSQNGKYELSPIAEAIIDKRITLSEYCFLLLSKQWIKIKDLGGKEDYKDNLLYIILEDLVKGPIKKSEFVSHFGEKVLNKYKDNYVDLSLSNQEAARYLIEPLLLSNLMIEDKDKYLVSSDCLDLVNDYILLQVMIKKLNEVSCADEEYWNDFQFGFYDIVNDSNRAIYSKHYPHLFNRATSNMAKAGTFDGHLQQIYYGAPGTGKSYTVDGICKKYEHFRTTFHPDSDYSTFVGCYKPIKEKAEKTIADTGNMDKDTLSIILQDRINNIGKQSQCDVLALFGYEYSESLSKLDKGDVKALVGAALKKQPGVSFSDNVYVGVGESLYEKYGKTSAKADSKITYSYSPQAFIKAYVKAWKMHENNEPVFLIIEEINRGNCAQIFGDLFQLLDRNALGYSSYEITPDDDLKNYIAEQGIQVSGVANSNNEDISKKIESGELLKLPPNLYIWATMNTSDQSLFPIDSAFKRRWDWKFVKITEGYEKDENGKPVMITGENGKPIKKKLGWQIKLSDEKTQDWWKFIQKVNEIIASMTSSADKQLGYFFCKPDLDKTTISAETFVSKVIFYLWNDVFKDFGFEDASLFRYKVNDKEEKDLTFPDFYDEDGEMVDTTRLTDFVDKVMNWKKTKEDND